MWLTLALCSLAACADVLGGLLTWWTPRLRSVALATGLGTGFLLGATLLDRLPDSMLDLPRTAPIYIGIGYLALLILERLGPMHSHAHMPSEAAEVTAAPALSREAALASFLGLLLHTFMDGVIIAGSFTVSRATGILMFVAITMHKLPEGFSMATITMAAGGARSRAVWTAVGLGLSTLAGALITLRLGDLDGGAVKVLMALATGTFLYISSSDLVPAVKAAGLRPALAVVVGFILFAASLSLVHAVGLT